MPVTGDETGSRTPEILTPTNIFLRDGPIKDGLKQESEDKFISGLRRSSNSFQTISLSDHKLSGPVQPQRDELQVVEEYEQETTLYDTADTLPNRRSSVLTQQLPTACYNVKSWTGKGYNPF